MNAPRPWSNVDLGELEDEPEELYAATHVANVACGGHAGDDASMERAVLLCLRHGAALGAHPSYPDRDGFGRRRWPMPAAALADAVAAQCARLATVARRAGGAPRFVKAHGALYHAADRDAALAAAVVDGALRGLGARPRDITFIGPPGGALARAAANAGTAYAREAFADRGVRADGTLIPRGEAGAVIADAAQVRARARELCARGDVETIGVHGDTPGAVALARAARAALDPGVRAVTRRRAVLTAFGDAAWRVLLPPGADARALLAALRGHPGVVDAVVTEEHAVAAFDPDAPPEGLAEAIDAVFARAGAHAPAAEAPRDHRVAVRYDGADLDVVAAAIGRTPRDVVALHSGRSYTAAAIGFQPGFAYLRGLDPALVVARRPTPRPRVPAASVAVAGPYTGVYPFASPGGWNLIGTAVDFEPFDSAHGARLALGDRVTFVEAR